jgi:hypothetical protein
MSDPKTFTNTRGWSVGGYWKRYAAGTHDFVTDVDGPGLPVRFIQLLAAGNLSMCKNEYGTDMPLTGLPDGYQHLGYTSAVTSSVAFVAYW